MRFEPLYTIRFFYPDGWQVNLIGKKGTEEDHFYHFYHFYFARKMRRSHLRKISRFKPSS
jgi:hypothetical protein